MVEDEELVLVERLVVSESSSLSEWDSEVHPNMHGSCGVSWSRCVVVHALSQVRRSGSRHSCGSEVRW